jgi:signal transduction histidine kinase
MKLRTKIVLGLSIILFAGFGFVHFWVNRVVETTILELENQNTKSHIERIEQALKNKEDFLLGKMRDWARWDDTHQFLSGTRPSYVNDNFRKPDELFANLKIDFFSLITNQKKIAYGISYDYEKSEVSQESKRLESFFSTLPLNVDTIGFVKNGTEYLYLVSIPVTKTDLTGENAGLLVAGYFVNTSFFSQLQELTQLKTQPQFDKIIATPTITKPSPTLIHAEVPIFQKSDGQGLFSVAIQTERKIFQTYLKVKEQISSIILLTFLGLFFVSLFFWELLIAKKLSHLNHWLQTTTPDEQTIPHYKIKSFDEIGAIAKSVNELFRKIYEGKDYIEKQNRALVHSERLKAIGEMAGGVAHEINNPLAIISGRLKQLLRESASAQPNKEKISDLGQKIESTIERISIIIRGLSTSVRQSDRDPLAIFSINEMIRDTLEMCHAKATKFEIQIKTEMDSTEGHLITAQKVPLSQVILNLVSNAIDELSKKPDLRWIRIKTEIQKEKLRIEVIDSGLGIPESIRQKLFQPFFTTKEIGQGTGLGLSISKGIVEAHDGQLYVDSNHENTCFVIEIPEKSQIPLAA